MQSNFRKRLWYGLSTIATATAIVAGTFVISSFDGSGSSGSSNSDFILKTDPPEDCSTSQVVYNNTSSSGSGSGSISGSGNASGGSGSVSGSGGSSSSQSGALGTLYTPKSKTDCSLSWNASCYSVDCHATGPATFTPFH